MSTPLSSTDRELPTAPTDVFDNLENLRLRQSFDRARTRKPLTAVGIRKPKRHEWWQAHPDYRWEGTLFLAQEEDMSDEWFFPTTQEALNELEALSASSLKEVCIFWWVNRKKNTYIWPVVTADVEGRQNEWHASMYEMMSVHGRGQWCRIEAGSGGYDVEIADGPDLPEPEWHSVAKFGDVLRVAFKKGGRVIDNLDHPLIVRLSGRKF